ncbi:hypothetical protein [Rheinheimera hassiensis]|uniref:hypothetical protein n=1 Tax=Rheinheimera hassiensis TaxID=1193627 RepID=UPI001F070A4A|nr:hypothetical protein [Rheinheimera hassiensis]
MPPKPSNRDDFSSQTKLMLEKRVGGVCSKPDCRSYTSGAHTNPDKSSSIGVAAHIRAAAQGGPRYDPSLTTVQRKSISNGIWLCQSCARLIDTDPARFPVTLLLEWKKTAEDTSIKRFGKKSISESEHNNEVMVAFGRGMLANATGGTSDPSAILSVIKGHERNLSELDPRLEVRLRSYESGSCIYEIGAKPGTTPSLNLLLINTPVVVDKVRQLKEFGKSTELPPESYKIEGSPLIEELFRHGEKANLILTGKNKDLETVVSFKNESGAEFELATFSTELSIGSKGGTIYGKALSGLITLELTYFNEGGSKFNLSFSINSWVGMRADKLQYFAKFKKLLNFLSASQTTNIVIELHHSVEPIILNSSDNISLENFIANLKDTIEIIDYSRVISAKLPQAVKFKNTQLSEDEYHMLLECHDRLTRSSSICPAGHVFCTGLISSDLPEQYKHFPNDGFQQAICQMKGQPVELNVLGNRVLAPALTAIIERFELAMFCPLSPPEQRQPHFQLTASENTTLSWEFDPKGSWKLLS